ncbi:hypothetical protein NSQ77_01575 [Oceanobacillus sp. FSL K6-2867]|uniref:hypothetical protein n=1 Tax=Oceanobacillus sp. FSL K6-2867 TaxID=2954748 RepID=UPI0030DCBF0A
MNHYLTHTELENLHYLIGEHKKIAHQLEVLAQKSEDPETRSKLIIDAQSAKLAHEQLLLTLR